MTDGDGEGWSGGWLVNLKFSGCPLVSLLSKGGWAEVSANHVIRQRPVGPLPLVLPDLQNPMGAVC
jgi:hypothetical protein